MRNAQFRVKMLLPIIIVLFSSVLKSGTSCCVQKERASSLLDAAVDLISKARSENISCPEELDITCGKVQDCADLFGRGFNKSGVYTIYPVNRLTSMKRVEVYCDMTTDGGGWTVIQRRGDFGRANDYFDQDWNNYKNGFGDLGKDFWLGNDNIFAMTNQRLYSARFDLEDKKRNTAYAHYDTFWIDDEFNSYTLHLSGYRGTAGDAMVRHNAKKFTTKDRGHGFKFIDGNGCGIKQKNGWWFNECYDANLNGMYNNHVSGINWFAWRKMEYLPRVEIKIRPLTFRISK